MFFLLPGIFKGNVRALALFFGAQGRQCLYLAPRPLRFAQASHLPRPYRSVVGVAKHAPPRRDHPTRLYKQRRDGAGSAATAREAPLTCRSCRRPCSPSCSLSCRSCRRPEPYSASLDSNISWHSSKTSASFAKLWAAAALSLRSSFFP